MLIRNKRPYAVEIVDTGQCVEAGETAEVPDEVGESLVQQVDAWEPADGGTKTVDDVLADVGDNPVRARRALALEHDSGKPRKSLVSRLEEIIATDEENS